MIETICGYDAKNDLIKNLELENMILRYDGAPMLAIYRYKDTKMFFLSWLNYGKLYEYGDEEYLLFAITGKERERLLRNEAATNILIGCPTRCCLYFKVLFDEQNKAYDEMIEGRPISLISKKDLFPSGVGIIP